MKTLNSMFLFLKDEGEEINVPNCEVVVFLLRHGHKLCQCN